MAAPTLADKPPLGPDPARGPALSLGYEFARTWYVGLNWISMPENTGAPGDQRATAFELSAQVAIANPRWLATAMVPLAIAHDGRTTVDAGAVTISDEAYLGNATFWLTRTSEPALAARSFVGVLAPAWSVGVVLPTGTRPADGESALARPLDDGYVHYQRDTLALLVGMRARADFFVLYSFTLDAGVEAQVLAAGDVLLHTTVLVAAEPLSILNQFEFGRRHQLSKRIRATAEWSYLREGGDATALPADPMHPGEDGIRHTFRVALDVAPWQGLQLALRRELRHYPDYADGWNVSVRHAW